MAIGKQATEDILDNAILAYNPLFYLPLNSKEILAKLLNPIFDSYHCLVWYTIDIPYLSGFGYSMWLSILNLSNSLRGQSPPLSGAILFRGLLVKTDKEV